MCREGFGMGVSQKTCRSLKAVFPRGLGKWFEKNINSKLHENHGEALYALWRGVLLCLKSD